MRIPSIMMELDFVFFNAHEVAKVHTGTIILSKSGAKVLIFEKNEDWL